MAEITVATLNLFDAPQGRGLFRELETRMSRRTLANQIPMLVLSCCAFS